MKRLSGVDVMLLYSETPEIQTHTLKIGLLDVRHLRGGYNFEAFRRMAYPRLLGLEPLRYQLVDIPRRLHHPMWRENAPIDPDYHLERVRVPAPGGRRELDELIGQIASVPLHRDRPLWKMYVAEGLVGHEIAVIWKVHHALADGLASANMIAKAMSAPDALIDAGLSARPDELPTRRQLIEYAIRDQITHLIGLPGLLSVTARGIVRLLRRSRQRPRNARLRRPLKPPRSFMNHQVSPQRRFATTSLALSDVKVTSKALELTVNDLVLSMAAGAIRKLALRYDGHADRPLIAGVPVSFNRSPDRIDGNDVGYMTPPLPIHISDIRERVRTTADAAAVAKENFTLLGPTMMASWLNYLPPALSPGLFRWQSRRWNSGIAMNLTISNVPGPRQASSVDGARITEIYSVGPLAAGCAMNITVWSYAELLTISVLVDDRTLNDPHEVTDAMAEEFTELRGLSAYQPATPTASTPADVCDRRRTR
ncbi:wax ester/triacylglycerol synthase family O-acyltransferase [Mycobacterium sp. 1274761.0]|uniref:wax ester/triacylglycerol synthase family O-acyltransferase n=1 Tax=Mycobacterium sp. 1274761.0 TaxID=1834077 RepID=UPI0007FF2436|nr:wax ester/triacylglycerol synthase family O-acyltransferase [Mycobacterium sp. 1274761.0]OBK71173.1 diacylglycerol O-acyltransferase [Mycobacterium sp. 1274761.0]